MSWRRVIPVCVAATAGKKCFSLLRSMRLMMIYRRTMSVLLAEAMRSAAAGCGMAEMEGRRFLEKGEKMVFLLPDGDGGEAEAGAAGAEKIDKGNFFHKIRYDSISNYY